MPMEVIWSYLVGAAVVTVGVLAPPFRGEWAQARRFDKLLALGPLCYAAPVAAFGRPSSARARSTSAA